jgi:antitoxin component HigA of HigAB toxin-antitoxin module
MKRNRRPRVFRSLQDWMDFTGTNQTTLARRVGVKPAHMSNVLRKSRRCSLQIALKLHEVTGVPITTIAAWPPKYAEDGK